jgi:hypothetical protein
MTKRHHLSPPQPAPAVEPARTNELSGIIKQSMLETFEQIGGVRGMKIWARKNRGAFYKLFAQLAPQLDRHSKGSGLVVQVAQYGANNGPAGAPPEQQLSLIDIRPVDAPPPESEDPDDQAAP